MAGLLIVKGPRYPCFSHCFLQGPPTLLVVISHSQLTDAALVLSRASRDVTNFLEVRSNLDDSHSSTAIRYAFFISASVAPGAGVL